MLTNSDPNRHFSHWVLVWLVGIKLRHCRKLFSVGKDSYWEKQFESEWLPYAVQQSHLPRHSYQQERKIFVMEIRRTYLINESQDTFSNSKLVSNHLVEKPPTQLITPIIWRLIHLTWGWSLVTASTCWNMSVSNLSQ